MVVSKGNHRKTTFSLQSGAPTFKTHSLGRNIERPTANHICRQNRVFAKDSPPKSTLFRAWRRDKSLPLAEVFLDQLSFMGDGPNSNLAAATADGTEECFIELYEQPILAEFYEDKRQAARLGLTHHLWQSQLFSLASFLLMGGQLHV